MFNLNYVLILASVMIISGGQLAFKYAANKIQVGSNATLVEMARVNVVPISIIVLALTMYLISTVAWVQALRSIPLSVAFMFNSLAFVIIPVLSWVFFGERMNSGMILGTFLIILGIAVIVLF